MSRSSVPIEIQKSVWRASGNRCSNPDCGATLFDRQLDIHHIIPEWEGGSTVFENLILLCEVCHSHYHRGNIGRCQIAGWKAHLCGKRKVVEPLVSAYSKFFYADLRRYRRQGRAWEILKRCQPIFFLAEDPEVVIDVGASYADALHCVGDDAAALDVIAAVHKVLIENPGIVGRPKRTARKLIVEARVLKAIGRMDSSVVASHAAQEIATLDQYFGWEVDFYLSSLDLLSLSNMGESPTGETFETAKAIASNVAPYLGGGKQVIDSVTALGIMAEARYIQAPYLISQGRFDEVEQSLGDALRFLEKARLNRSLFLRLVNYANAKLIRAEMCPSKRCVLNEEADSLFAQALLLGIRNEKGSPQEHSVWNEIARFRGKFVALRRQRISPQDDPCLIGRLLKA